MFPKFTIYFAAIAVCVSTLSAAQIKPRIRGGDHAAEGQFPYMVLFVDRQTGLPVGDGAIVSSRHIITSAFGLRKYELNPEKLIAVLGAWKIGQDEHKSDVAEVHLNSGFKADKFSFDIAVVKTTDEIEFNHLVRAVALPDSDLISGGVDVVVSGFGLTAVSFNLKLLSRNLINIDSLFCKYFQDPRIAKRELNLQYFETVTIDRSECENRMIEKFYPPVPPAEKFICTKNPVGVGICFSDDGSPMVADNKLVGIASWNVECSRGPDVFTNVFTHLNFIKSHMN